MIKRLLDFLFASMGLIVLSPLLLIIAALVKLTSPGPVLFCQQRVGRCFRPFTIYKFRTMVAGAQHRGGALTHGEADPRITKVGRFLRRTKIDELPQLWNVVKGEMSLVGPRPEVAKYVERFREQYAEILQVRPGITDLASLKYRHEAKLLGSAEDPDALYTQQILPDKIAISKQYLADRSLWLDAMIVWKTVMGRDA